jgi:predicted methyltransferase
MRRTAVTLQQLLTAATCSLLALAALGQQSLETNVRPGVNDRWVTPDLDAQSAAQTFESDTREVYLRRHDVVAALDLQPGMTVADVGAGSGFYVSLFAEEVGPSGRVYAVELAPNWIEYLDEKVEEEGLSQVSVVRGTERSVELPESSLDLIFASDTYHHFEYPQSSLASIYSALKPGGLWVVLDYDKIPGVTSPSRMDHLRLGKAEAMQEILAAGFTLDRDIDLDFKDNYLAVFRRP